MSNLLRFLEGVAYMVVFVLLVVCEPLNSGQKENENWSDRGARKRYTPSGKF